MSSETFFIEVGDEAYVTVDEVWPDGNAPDNPTTEDVIEVIKGDNIRDWGFESHIYVDGKYVGVG